MTDPADVDVDEIRAGIVADAAARQRQGKVSEAGCAYARQPDVDRLGLHVEAVASDPNGMGPQKLVARRRAIAADDLNFSTGVSHRRNQIGE